MIRAENTVTLVSCFLVSSVRTDISRELRVCCGVLCVRVWRVWRVHAACGACVAGVALLATRQENVCFSLIREIPIDLRRARHNLATDSVIKKSDEKTVLLLKTACILRHKLDCHESMFLISV